MAHSIYWIALLNGSGRRGCGGGYVVPWNEQCRPPPHWNAGLEIFNHLRTETSRRFLALLFQLSNVFGLRNNILFMSEDRRRRKAYISLWSKSLINWKPWIRRSELLRRRERDPGFHLNIVFLVPLSSADEHRDDLLKNDKNLGEVSHSGIYLPVTESREEDGKWHFVICAFRFRSQVSRKRLFPPSTMVGSENKSRRSHNMCN